MKIGLLLPACPDLGQIFLGRALAERLAAVRMHAPVVQVAIGLPGEQDDRWVAAADELRAAGPHVQVRHLVWQHVPSDQAANMYAGKLDPAKLVGIKGILVPRDWGWNFMDCDLWLSLADPGHGAVAPLRPIVHYCRDLAVRYVPHAFAQQSTDPYWQRQAEAFALWRRAIVMVGDPAAITDVHGYAGVRAERIMSIEPLYGPAQDHALGVVRNTIDLGWMTEASCLDDLETCLRGFAVYRAEGGTITPAILSMNPAAFRPEAARLPAELGTLLTSLPQREIFSPMALSRVMRSVRVLMSSRLAGGDGEALAYAHTFGARTLCVDQPTNRIAARRLGIQPVYYPGGDPLALADALHGLSEAATGISKTTVIADSEKDVALTVPIDVPIARAWDLFHA